MNCATHNDTAAVAFCRTCGKPLCAQLHPRRPRSGLLRALPRSPFGGHSACGGVCAAFFSPAARLSAWWRRR